MNVLGIEASGSAVAMCALHIEGEIATPRALFCSPETRQMSRLLMENLDATLSRADWKLDDINALCVGLGPGSWTSLRIVLSVIKTLAQTREIPLAGVATFEAAAHAVLADEQKADSPQHFALLMLAPSRTNEQYARLFWAENGAVETLHAESVGAPQEIAARVLASTRARAASPLLLCDLGGVPREAFSHIAQTLSQGFSEVRGVNVSPEEVTTQIARLGAQKIARGEADNALTLLPIYVAPSAAERVREENLAAASKAAAIS